MTEVAPAICVKDGAGVVFPLFGNDEQAWPRGLRIVLYLVGLAWCFMGVAIVSDVFMSSIEKITSKKKRRFDAQRGRFYTYEVWNPTVANLTLMALGSSAPEILLNVIDMFAKEYIVEGLGPSTIVGSAAFNLLMIIAVCIAAIPAGEVRTIKYTQVYTCTAMWSVFAYLWLLIILQGFSPHVVELWEGIVTFLCFPTLIISAFAVDKGYLGGGTSSEAAGAAPVGRKSLLYDGMSKEDIAELEAKVREKHGDGLSGEQVAKIIAVMYPMQRSMAHYRVYAMRKLFAGKKVSLVSAAKRLGGGLGSIAGLGARVSPEPMPPKDEAKMMIYPLCEIDVECQMYAVLENAGKVAVKIVRIGAEDTPVAVHYWTSDGTAKAHDDYMPIEGTLVFQAGQTEAELEIAIIDDAAYEEDEEFFVHLGQPTCAREDVKVVLRRTKVTVVIIDDDSLGVVAFPEEHSTVYQQATDFVATFPVQRTNGSSGEISVNYSTESATALAGRDFEPTSGTLVFGDMEMEAYIEVTIKAQGRYESADHFRIVLSEPSGGARFDPQSDGGHQKTILTVSIEADECARQRIDHLKNLLQVKWDKAKIGHANWASQFKAAIKVNGGEQDDMEEGEEPVPATMPDYIVHFVTLPWKVLFAFVPPVDYCDGWVCFCASLFMIGIVTMIINDLASLLGCVMCIPDDITAITFVALGTSLPDTFASRTAALQDPHADASVGNVTGSNSVNVFLGLGLPWMIASFKWAVAGRSELWWEKYGTDQELSWLDVDGIRQQAFVVKAGSLAFSVCVFTGCAVSCIALLAIRRRTIGGELGGPRRIKYASCGILAFFWLTYISLSSWKSLQSSGGITCPS